MSRVCSSCLIDESTGVSIKENGICKYCALIDEHRDVIDAIGCKENILKQRINLFSDKGQYDCIVGLSGGKDSSYMVYRLKSNYNARVLTYTNDNGFLTPYAKENIEGIVRDFGVDHVWMRPGSDYLRAIYRSNLKKEGWPCSACVHMGESAIWTLAYEKKIPFIISGRTPEQILRRPDESCFLEDTSLVMSNLSPYDRERAVAFARRTMQRIHAEREWLLEDRHHWENAIYLHDLKIRDDFTPEYLYFFLYEPHDDLKIMEVLEKETSWRNKAKIGILSHLDCAAHDAAGYLFSRMNGYPFVSLETNALVRHGLMEREDASRHILKEKMDSSALPAESIRTLSQVSGIDPLILPLLPWLIKGERLLKGVLRKILK